MKCDKQNMLLYAVTDRAWVGKQSLYEQVESALKGGVTCVQLREKELDDEAFLKEAVEIHALCQRYGVPFFVNDNVDIAIRCHAEGVHVGQEDMAAAQVRARVGEGMMIGVSVHSVEEAQEAVKHGAELRQSCTVTGLITENGTVTGVRAKYKGEDVTLKSRIVMIADGAFSSLGKSLGIAHEKPYSMWIGERAYFKNVNLDRSLAKDQYNAYGVFGFSELTGPGYFWVMPVGRDGVRDGICNVGVMVNDLDAYRQADLQERFYKWSGSIPKIGEMFERAVRISPWEGGRMNDISQGVQKAGDGYMVIGDAAALTMPLVHDGLSAVADSAKAAALAALGAFMAGDVSGENLMNEYMRAYKMKSERVTMEQLKLKRLLMESMHDPSVMDKTIELLETDPIYRKSHLKR